MALQTAASDPSVPCGQEQRAGIYQPWEIWVTSTGAARRRGHTRSRRFYFTSCKPKVVKNQSLPGRTTATFPSTAPSCLHANAPGLRAEFHNPFPAASLCFHSLNDRGEFSLHHRGFFLPEAGSRALTLLRRGFWAVGGEAVLWKAAPCLS